MAGACLVTVSFDSCRPAAIYFYFCIDRLLLRSLHLPNQPQQKNQNHSIKEKINASTKC